MTETDYFNNEALMIFGILAGSVGMVFGDVAGNTGAEAYWLVSIAGFAIATGIFGYGAGRTKCRKEQ